MNEISVKIILLGDSSVGKSSLMLRFTDNIYEENKVSTIGVEFKNKYIKINNQKIKLIIYDTSGQERYHSLSKSFIRKAKGIIFVFDLTNEASFENINNWLMTSNDVIQNYKKILVGNKLDLNNGQIDTKRIEKFCEKHNMEYFEASAKKGTNVNKIFNEIARLILDIKQNKEKEIDNQSTEITIHDGKSKKAKECCK